MGIINKKRERLKQLNVSKYLNTEDKKKKKKKQKKKKKLPNLYVKKNLIK